MSVTINIEEEVILDGKSVWKVTPYRIKDYDELTLDDWKTLTVPRIEKPEKSLRAQLAVTYEMLRRHTGIEKSKLKKLPTDQASKLIEHIGALLAEAVSEADKEFKDYTPPAEIVHQGKTYRVPTDLERGTIWQQWEEIDLADKIEHEADIYRHFLSILLVEKGRAFEPQDVPAKDEAFGSMTMVTIFPLCAFFFGSNERFRTAINSCSQRYSSSIRQQVQQALRHSPPSGA